MVDIAKKVEEKKLDDKRNHCRFALEVGLDLEDLEYGRQRLDAELRLSLRSLLILFQRSQAQRRKFTEG